MDISPQAPEVSIDEASIILIGDFNPKIFHPMWFAHHGILRESEAKDAEVELIHADVSSFSTDWLSVQVLRDRFSAGVKAEVYRPHLGDLVRNVFTLLSHTPVRQMGVNVTFRFNFRSEDDRHAFGHMLTPKSPWAGVLERPGLRTLTIQGRRADKYRGLVNITVEPDMRRPDDAIARYNDHFEAPHNSGEEPTGAVGSKWLLEILEQDFVESYERATKDITKLVDAFTATKTVDAGE